MDFTNARMDISREIQRRNRLLTSDFFKIKCSGEDGREGREMGISYLSRIMENRLISNNTGPIFLRKRPLVANVSAGIVDSEEVSKRLTFFEISGNKFKFSIHWLCFFSDSKPQHNYI